jgi:hypothetical protein
MIPENAWLRVVLVQVLNMYGFGVEDAWPQYSKCKAAVLNMHG